MSVYSEIRDKITTLEETVEDLKAKYFIMTELSAENADIALAAIDSTTDDAISLLG